MVIDFQTKEELKKLFSERVAKKARMATVISAYKLDDEDKSRLITKVARLAKGVSVEYKVDETLLAGVVIKMGSSIIDLSLKGQLLNFQQKMYESS